MFNGGVLIVVEGLRVVPSADELLLVFIVHSLVVCTLVFMVHSLVVGMHFPELHRFKSGIGGFLGRGFFGDRSTG